MVKLMIVKIRLNSIVGIGYFYVIKKNSWIMIEKMVV